MPAQSVERDLMPCKLKTIRKHAFQVSRATVHIVDAITFGTMKVMVMGIRNFREFISNLLPIHGDHADHLVFKQAIHHSVCGSQAESRGLPGRNFVNLLHGQRASFAFNRRPDRRLL
jgi:hypothetical protein